MISKYGMALTIGIFLLLMNKITFQNCSYTNYKNKSVSSKTIINDEKLQIVKLTFQRFVFCIKAQKLNSITNPMQLSIKQELDLISIKFSYFGIIFFTFYVLKYLHIDIYCYLSTQRPPISSLLFTRQKICIS